MQASGGQVGTRETRWPDIPKHDEYDKPTGARLATQPKHKRQKEKLHPNPSYPAASKQ